MVLLGGGGTFLEIDRGGFLQLERVEPEIFLRWHSFARGAAREE